MSDLDTVSVVATITHITQQQLSFIVVSATQLAQLHTHTHTYIYTYIYIYTHIYTYTHTYSTFLNHHCYWGIHISSSHHRNNSRSEQTWHQW